MRGRSTPQARARPCHCQRRGFTSISLKRPSRGSSRNSVCAMPWKPERRSSVSACSTTSSRQRASPTRQVPKPRGICTSLRPQNSAERGARRRPCRSRPSTASRRRRGSTSCSSGSQSAALRQASTSSSGVVADEHRPPEAPLERDRIARLDDGRVAERAPRPRAPRPRCRRRTCSGTPMPGGLGDRVLVALALQRLEHVPAAAGQLVGGQARGVARDGRERRVVRREAPRRAPRSGARRARPGRRRRPPRRSGRARARGARGASGSRARSAGGRRRSRARPRPPASGWPRGR